MSATQPSPDLDAIRAGSPIGPETVTALCDEVERLKAENTLLGEALDEAVSDNAVFVGAFRARRDLAVVTNELAATVLKYGTDLDPDPEAEARVDRAHAAADAAIDADAEIRKAHDLIHERILAHIRAAYDAHGEAA